MPALVCRTVRRGGACACQIRLATRQWLGKTRWVVERSIAWRHSFRPPEDSIRRYAHVHEAFLFLACSLICWSRPKPFMS